MPPIDLVVFDCDGVLVDSEPIACAVLAEGLRELGFPADLELVYERFLGRDVPAIERIMAEELGWRPPAERLAALRPRLHARFRRELRAMPGAAETVAALAVPCCVASSSSVERVRLSLELTGLLGPFEARIFSAAMVARGKPAPDLFLLAAERMGAAPAACLVVEDSEAGIRAAKAAGMAAVNFTGGGHAGCAGYGERLLAAGAERVIGALPELVPLLGGRAGS